MELNIKIYNEKEKIRGGGLSNRFLEAFQPVAFDKVGYPTRINDDKELIRYVDVLHELREEFYYKNFLYGITVDEFELLKHITVKVLNFTKDTFGKDILVKSPILSSIGELRQINHISKDEKELPTIFEIGAGSGYLGALLYFKGYNYISTDVTQSLYLYQNKLWNYLSKGNLYEAFDKIENISCEIKKNKMVHVPYWNLLKLAEHPFKVDIFMANHCLYEMHENSLLFYLKLASILMKDSKYKLFAFQTGGAPIIGNGFTLIKSFYKMGFELLYSDYCITIFCLKNKSNINPATLEEFLEGFYINSIDIPNINNFKDYTANKINSGKSIMRKLDKIKYDDILKFYKSVSSNFYSPDEKFLNFVTNDNYKRIYNLA